MASIAVFLVLGGAAYAAHSLPKKSVGAAQLKANSVTTAKIKKNAVTKKKIKNGAVTGSKLGNDAVTSGKIADGTVTGADINVGSTPFGRVVAEMRSTGSVAVVSEAFQNLPLNPSTYTQAPDENDTYVGAVDVTFQPTCEAPRSVVAVVVLDSPNPTLLEEEKLVAVGITSDEGSGTVTKKVQIGPYVFLGTRFEPGVATNHTANLILEGECETGSGITATSGALDVIGTK